MTGKTKSIVLSNVFDEISLDGIIPVIPDKEFNKFKERISR